MSVSLYRVGNGKVDFLFRVLIIAIASIGARTSDASAIQSLATNYLTHLRSGSWLLGLCVLWWFAVPRFVPWDTWTGGEEIDLKGSPSTKTGPMLSELIRIGHLAEDCQIGSSGIQIINILGKCAPGSGLQENGKRVVISREKKGNFIPRVQTVEGERRRSGFRNNLELRVNDRVPRWAFANVLYRKGPCVNGVAFSEGIFKKCRPQSDPRTLIDFKIVPKIFPLAVSDDGVSYASSYSYALEDSPTTWPFDSSQPLEHRAPYGEFITLFLSFLGLEWGLLNLRNNQRMIYSPLLFLGCVVGMFFSFLVVLPWISARPF